MRICSHCVFPPYTVASIYQSACSFQLCGTRHVMSIAGGSRCLVKGYHPSDCLRPRIMEPRRQRRFISVSVSAGSFVISHTAARAFKALRYHMNKTTKMDGLSLPHTTSYTSQSTSEKGNMNTIFQFTPSPIFPSQSKSIHQFPQTQFRHILTNQPVVPLCGAESSITEQHLVHRFTLARVGNSIFLTISNRCAFLH